LFSISSISFFIASSSNFYCFIFLSLSFSFFKANSFYNAISFSNFFYFSAASAYSIAKIAAFLAYNSI
jgi:hypothetical protein